VAPRLPGDRSLPLRLWFPRASRPWRGSRASHLQIPRLPLGCGAPQRFESLEERAPPTRLPAPKVPTRTITQGLPGARHPQEQGGQLCSRVRGQGSTFQTHETSSQVSPSPSPGVQACNSLSGSGCSPRRPLQGLGAMGVGRWFGEGSPSCLMAGAAHAVAAPSSWPSF